MTTAAHCILVTDEVDDDHYTLQCRSGCTLARHPLTLQYAAADARHHAIMLGHVVEITDARVVACCCAEIPEDLRPCEPCWLRLSPAAREGAQ